VSEDQTICDRCGEEVYADEINDMPEESSWRGCTICNECAAQLEKAPKTN
jgi:formylmethanofuran dehydrogenase subunit E